eukprot:7479228-Pyramimonas_sp.AAC.1
MPEASPRLIGETYLRPFRPAQALVREAKHGGVGDMDRQLASNIARKARYRQDRDGEEEYDNDGGLDLVEDGKRRKGDQRKQIEEEKKRQ